MTDQIRKNNFNLIGKELEFKEKLKTERDWYALFNILAVCMVAIVCITSYLLKINLESKLNKRSQELSTKINSNLNTNSKYLLDSKISVLRDKFNIYQETLSRNFDVKKFIEEVENLYAGLKIDRFVANTELQAIEVDIKVETDGYNQIPKIIDTLEKNPKFKNTTITSIVFEPTKSSTTENVHLVEHIEDTESLITIVKLSIPKSSIFETANGSTTSN